MKKVIHINEDQFNKRLKVVNEAREAFQNVLEEFNSLGLPIKVNSKEELLQLSSRPEAWIKQQVEESLPIQSLGAYKIKREASFELLDMPSFDKLIESTKIVRGGNDRETGATLPSYFSEMQYLALDKGKVTIAEQQVQELRDSFSIIATTKQQADMFEAYKKAAEALAALNQSFKEVSGNIAFHGNSRLGEYFDLTSEGIIGTNVYFLEQNKVNLFR